MPIRKGQTEIEVCEKFIIDHADSQRILKERLTHNGGYYFYELLLR